MLRHAVVVLAVAVFLGAPSTALAAQKMWVGFQDNVNFEWNHDRSAMLDTATQAHASLIRISVDWWKIAPRRPRDPANYLDPAYRFQSLDELTQHAQQRGLQVMFTIWGTPSWANAGAAPNRPPTDMGDLRRFAQALSSRYSGRHSGLPFVGYYTVWNESNMGRFLSPQYDGAGRPESPRLYASIYRAARGGIKAGNPLAKIGIGETSSHGRLTPPRSRGAQATLAPARFAQLLAHLAPTLQFDAWSLHPYPTAPTLAPSENSRWPNVTMARLGQFERSIDTWFGRKHIPIWITEYGYETKPAEPRGVTETQQSSYLRQAFQLATRDPNVKMFIWFMLRDDPTSAWQSGLLARNGQRKPSFTTFTTLAATADMREPLLLVRGGTANPRVRFSALELMAHSPVGANVGATIRVFDQGRLVAVSQPTGTLGIDGFVTLNIPLTVKKGHHYRVEARMNTIHGDRLDRSATIIGT